MRNCNCLGYGKKGSQQIQQAHKNFAKSPVQAEAYALWNAAQEVKSHTSVAVFNTDSLELVKSHRKPLNSRLLNHGSG